MDITTLLFQTKAVRVCPSDKPFWYTSGMLGPYYINTHYLYGNEAKAAELLKIIDTKKTAPATCATELLEILTKNYEQDRTYRATIDYLAQTLTAKYPAETIDYISGGERRDWIFSLPVAQLLGIPHITMFKDGNIAPINAPRRDQTPLVVHIADLLNTASSYERAWIPILSARGLKMRASLVVVDRNQGGGEYLQAQSVENLTCVTINADFFSAAATAGHINAEQLRMIKNYTADPKKYMQDFLRDNPEYLNTAKNINLSRSLIEK